MGDGQRPGTASEDSALVPAHTYFLFPPLLPFVLCVLQHLLPPQVKEVGRIGVELQTLFPIVPLQKKKKKSYVLVNDSSVPPPEFNIPNYFLNLFQHFPGKLST